MKLGLPLVALGALSLGLSACAGSAVGDLLANDLHPTDAGYATMARTWWAAIASLPAAR